MRFASSICAGSVVPQLTIAPAGTAWAAATPVGRAVSDSGQRAVPRNFSILFLPAKVTERPLRRLYTCPKSRPVPAATSAGFKPRSNSAILTLRVVFNISVVQSFTQLGGQIKPFQHFFALFFEGSPGHVSGVNQGAKAKPYKPLLYDEVLVCHRVSRIRGEAGLSQTTFARRIGVTRDRVASVENKRVSLKWPMGFAICRSFNVSQLWLAKGVEPIHPFFDLHGTQDWNAIPDATPFSVVCNGPLSEDLALRHDLLMESAGAISRPGLASAFYAKAQDYLNEELALVPEVCRLAFLDGLPAALTRLAAKVEVRSIQDVLQNISKNEEAKPSAAPEACKNKSTSLLTEPASYAKLVPVKSQLDNLLAGLDRLVKEPGSKTALADFLGAPLASVSRWLSGKREPGREITLKMLRWVEQQERQQNTPGSATNTTKGKTQLSKSSYEKPKPGPKK
jgi:DNA-binding XRE family transcriptional regulator